MMRVVCLSVCVSVCLFVRANKENYWTDLKNSFFVRKVWTAKVTWAILEVSHTTPSCRKPNKPLKNGVFRTSEAAVILLTAQLR